jgi:hypothetical protein
MLLLPEDGCVRSSIGAIHSLSCRAGDKTSALWTVQRMKDEGWFKVHGRIQNGVPEENRPIEAALRTRDRLPEEMCAMTPFEASAGVDLSVVRALGGSPLVTDFVMARWHAEVRTIEVESPNNPLFHLGIRLRSLDGEEDERKRDGGTMEEFEAKTVLGDPGPKTPSDGDRVTVRWDVRGRRVYVRWNNHPNLHLDIPLPDR